jgi:hypothetical protein
MTNKKFIGGGFPGIKECINEKNILTKESREKREFSVRKLIPINQILTKQNKNNNIYDELITNIKYNDHSTSEELNIIDNIKYNSIDNFLHNSQFENIKVNKTFDINLINGPINRTLSSVKRSTKRSSKRSSKRSKKQSKKQSSKKQSKKTSKKTF